ncbi:MAG TPA: hypothetical protein VNV85_06130 [Puia sp.]|jgi:hypothetical protein|nr:hypothetical protein [Puia sp.]
MSHGTSMPVTPPEHNGNNTNSESFGEWAVGQVPFLVTQLISLLLALSTFIYYVTHGEEKLAELANFNIVESILFCFNLAFCIFCVIKLQAIYPDNSKGEFNAKRLFNHTFQANLSETEHNKRRKQSAYLLKRFKFYFLCFWIVMVALYAVFAVETFSAHREEPPKGRMVKEEKTIESTYLLSDEKKNIFEITQTKKHSLLKFGDSVDLSHPDMEIPRVSEQSEYHTWLQALQAKWDGMLTYWLNTISIMFILWCFSIMAVRAQHPSSLRKLPTIIRLSPFLTFLLVALYPSCLGFVSHNGVFYEESLNNYTVLFDALSGVINAVVFALFIARLDSKFVSLPSNLIGLLYLYSAIQPLFMVFDSPGFVNETIKVCVLLLVFVLKIYFFFIITYAIQEGKIFAYLYCFGTLNERVEAFTQNHYSIRVMRHEFHLICSVFLKKSELFKVNGKWHELPECVEFIKILRIAASNPNNFHLQEIADATYIVIKNQDGIKYCTSSKPVSSKQNFAGVRDDAYIKIPYCNVDLSEAH